MEFTSPAYDIKFTIYSLLWYTCESWCYLS